VAVHPDVEAEQAHLDRARACLVEMRSRTTHALANVGLAATEVDTEIARWVLERRLNEIDDDAPALCFGRIDEESGDRWHVGRRHVEDTEGDAVVVDWRAPVSTPFYRATVQDPLGLHRRRRFSLEGARLVDILEEDFTDPDGGVISGGIPDPLLAELERERTGEMRDIVATIAAEQDIVIRSPLHALLVVQGGPGTGKTAVALHRAAYLLYEHRAYLQERRVLVIGPNDVFLRYISGVLPSLGETAVVQSTLEGLVAARHPVTRTDADVLGSLKGDRRIASVLAELVDARIRPPDEQIVLTSAWGRVRLEPREVRVIVDEIRARRVPHNVGREALRNQLLHLAYERHERTATTPALKARFVEGARADKGFQSLITRIWPAISASALVRQLFGGSAALRAAATDHLDGGELALLRRGGGQGWAAADIPLLDEAEALISGVGASYGHVVVDEAQDLSAMAFRMVGRRSPTGSFTIVGDLAQATTAWAQDRWEDAIAVLSATSSAPAHLEHLTVGYRLPAPLLDLANRLVRLAAPQVPQARSIRMTGDPPAITRVDDLVAGVTTEAHALASRFGSVAVIAPSATHEALEAAFDAAGLPWAAGSRVGLGERVTLLDSVGAKGLEFDAAIVVEPAAIIAERARGVQALFVALTRAVQHLSIVHADDLPEALTT
jgi:DNA helicase IV